MMKLVVRVKLPPSPEQAQALQATLRACNEAVYHELKARFVLSAQPTMRVLGKVCDAYTTRQANLKAGNLGRKGSPRRQRATSTGDRFVGRHLNRQRRQQNELRAKRVLKRLRRREARRARDVNHTISKRIVERAERTDHGIVLGDLRGIRGRPTPLRRARSATTPADATGPPETGSSAEAVVWCCTPMSMLHATSPTEAKWRG
ncbi:probable transposase [Nocardiopsis sp. JB363]|nr:probable transposase [Nocardiopsis sp. JB363]